MKQMTFTVNKGEINEDKILIKYKAKTSMGNFAGWYVYISANGGKISRYSVYRLSSEDAMDIAYVKWLKENR